MSIAGFVISTLARRSANRFAEAAKTAGATQQALLLKMVQQSANTEYGKSHDFAAIRSVKDYQQNVPIVTYDNIREAVDRVCRGEKNILTAEDPVMFAQTSGTTGKAKFIPMTPSCRNQAQQDQMRTWLHHAKKDHPDIFDGQIVSLVSPAVEGHTESGVPFGSTSGQLYKSMPGLVKSIYAIPYEVFEIEDYETKYYVLMRIALDQDVRFLATANPSSILKLCEKADQYADRLIEDIRAGTLRKELDIAAKTRQIVEKKLRPNPKRAAELEAARAKRGGRLLPADYWPKLSLIGCWKGGTVGHYLEKFPGWFDPDNERPVAVRDWGFLSSEARCSVPLSDEGCFGVLSLAANFFEFVEVDDLAANPDDYTRWTFYTVEQIRECQPYYIFLTTTGGLYRYDINDVIEVGGFYHGAPLIKFLRKGRGMTNITGEKLSVNQVIDAVQQASRQSGLLVSHFKAEADTENSRYLLRMEPLSNPEDGDLHRFLEAFENSLNEINIEYKSKRQSQRLQLPVLHLMREGWYERQRKTEVEGGKRMFQAKTELLSPIKAKTVMVKPELIKVIEISA